MNVALVLIPLGGAAAYLLSSLHVMVIWPNGEKPQVHYFWKSNDREAPEPVAKLADAVGR